MKRNLLKKLIVVCFSSMILSSCFTPVNNLDAKLNLTDVSILKGSSKQLCINSVTYYGTTVESGYTYTWSSENSDVVKVSADGLATAVEAGTTYVAANISYNNLNIVKKCMFIVTSTDKVAVTLNNTTANVQVGRTLQLNATVVNCANKTVTWSSDSLYATVSSNGMVQILDNAPEGQKITITATSVYDPKAKASCVITVIPRTSASLDYTIMYYMCASTLENDGNYGGGGGWRDRASSASPGLFTADLKEILSVDLPDTVKILVETGGTTKWAMPSSYLENATSISADKLQRWEVSNGKLRLISTLTTNHMADQNSFESFVEWGLKNYDSEQAAVVISGHGGGIAGCAYDDNYRSGYNYNCLDLTEIATALDTALTAGNRDKLTWMGFDCCLMQTADYASVLADYADYMVASQESEAGEGWDHDVYLKLLKYDPTTQPSVLLDSICKSFTSEVHTTYCNYGEYAYETLSALDLTKMDAFTNAFNSYVAETGSGKTEYSKYKSAFNSSVSFGEDAYGLVDFTSYLNNLKSQFSSVSTTNLEAALRDVIMCNYVCSKYSPGKKPCGLSVFLPEASSRDGLQVVKADYTGSLATKFSAYQSMCLNYGTW